MICLGVVTVELAEQVSCPQETLAIWRFPGWRLRDFAMATGPQSGGAPGAAASSERTPVGSSAVGTGAGAEANEPRSGERRVSVAWDRLALKYLAGSRSCNTTWPGLSPNGNRRS